MIPLILKAQIKPTINLQKLFTEKYYDRFKKIEREKTR